MEWKGFGRQRSWPNWSIIRKHSPGGAEVNHVELIAFVEVGMKQLWRNLYDEVSHSSKDVTIRSILIVGIRICCCWFPRFVSRVSLRAGYSFYVSHMLPPSSSINGLAFRNGDAGCFLWGRNWIYKYRVDASKASLKQQQQFLPLYSLIWISHCCPEISMSFRNLKTEAAFSTETPMHTY
jgi:hypothetical protein